MKRFTAHHIEYEPEWETAFNIQLKSLDCITLLLRWCSSNSNVLIEAYKIVLKHLLSHRDVATCRVTGLYSDI